MLCANPRCTGNHDNRKRDNLCPATREKGRLAQQRYYNRTQPEQLQKMARYRTTAAFMLSQVKHEATRRGGRSRATAK